MLYIENTSKGVYVECTDPDEPSWLTLNESEIKQLWGYLDAWLWDHEDTNRPKQAHSVSPSQG